jgi:hypothetical protein
MSMTIIDVVECKYPGQINLGNVSFRKPENEILINEWNVPNVERPSELELEAEIPQYQRQFNVQTFKKDIDAKVSALLNSTAQSRGYSDSQSIVSYVSSSNTQWQAEAQAFVSWRDQVWERIYIEYMAIDAGGSIPNEDMFMVSLPQIVWPS